MSLFIALSPYIPSSLFTHTLCGLSLRPFDLMVRHDGFQHTLNPFVLLTHGFHAGFEVNNRGDDGFCLLGYLLKLSLKWNGIMLII